MTFQHSQILSLRKISFILHGIQEDAGLVLFCVDTLIVCLFGELLNFRVLKRDGFSGSLVFQFDRSAAEFLDIPCVVDILGRGVSDAVMRCTTTKTNHTKHTNDYIIFHFILLD